jgi:hypothetical protein
MIDFKEKIDKVIKGYEMKKANTVLQSFVKKSVTMPLVIKQLIEDEGVLFIKF